MLNFERPPTQLECQLATKNVGVSSNLHSFGILMFSLVIIVLVQTSQKSTLKPFGAHR